MKSRDHSLENGKVADVRVTLVEEEEERDLEEYQIESPEIDKDTNRCYVLTNPGDILNVRINAKANAAEFYDLYVDGILRISLQNAKPGSVFNRTIKLVCHRPKGTTANKRKGLEMCRMQVKQRDSSNDIMVNAGETSEVGTLVIKCYAKKPEIEDEDEEMQDEVSDIPTFEKYPDWADYNSRLIETDDFPSFEIGMITGKKGDKKAKDRVDEVVKRSSSYKLWGTFTFCLCSEHDLEKLGFNVDTDATPPTSPEHDGSVAEESRQPPAAYETTIEPAAVDLEASQEETDEPLAVTEAAIQQTRAGSELLPEEINHQLVAVETAVEQGRANSEPAQDKTHHHSIAVETAIEQGRANSGPVKDETHHQPVAVEILFEQARAASEPFQEESHQFAASDAAVEEEAAALELAQEAVQQTPQSGTANEQERASSELFQGETPGKSALKPSMIGGLNNGILAQATKEWLENTKDFASNLNVIQSIETDDAGTSQRVREPQSVPPEYEMLGLTQSMRSVSVAFNDPRSVSVAFDDSRNSMVPPSATRKALMEWVEKTEPMDIDESLTRLIKPLKRFRRAPSEAPSDCTTVTSIADAADVERSRQASIRLPNSIGTLSGSKIVPGSFSASHSLPSPILGNAFTSKPSSYQPRGPVFGVVGAMGLMQRVQPSFGASAPMNAFSSGGSATPFLTAPAITTAGPSFILRPANPGFGAAGSTGISSVPQPADIVPGPSRGSSPVVMSRKRLADDVVGEESRPLKRERTAEPEVGGGSRAEEEDAAAAVVRLERIKKERLAEVEELRRLKRERDAREAAAKLAREIAELDDEVAALKGELGL